jgi:trk system potassium uptake protein TrkH
MRARTLEDRQFGRPRRPVLHRPGQLVVAAFALASLAGTGLLLLPWAATGPGSAGLLDAAFTAVSAICVTGMSPVDVSAYWTVPGQVTIMALIQVGGFGIMTLASLLALLVTRRLGLRSTLSAATEGNTVSIGDVRTVIVGVLKVSLVIEAATAAVLALRFATAYDESPGRALWLGAFHGVSGFNNAGFTLFSDGLVGFVGDPWICLPLCAAVILGGVGFPVLFEVRRELRRIGRWSLHTQLTLGGTLFLLVAGFVVVTAGEWTNPATLGAHDAPTRLLAGFTQGVMPRSGGLNSLDHAEMREPTVFATSLLMFIGGGSASTAGGIKVTTFLLLFFVIVAEVRGGRDVEVSAWRVERRAQRQALTVALLSVGLIVGATMLMMWLTGLALNDALFETMSAATTTGLSIAGTGSLPDSAQVLLLVLMFVGRLGPVTLVSALALRDRQHRYRLPEGRPLIG